MSLNKKNKRIRRIQFIIFNFIKRLTLLLTLLTDKANSKFDLKIKEALYINWRKPNLNAQQNNLALTL